MHCKRIGLALWLLAGCGGRIDPTSTFATHAGDDDLAPSRDAAALPARTFTWTRVEPTADDKEWPGTFTNAVFALDESFGNVLMYGVPVTGAGSGAELWVFKIGATWPRPGVWINLTPSKPAPKWPVDGGFGPPAAYDFARRKLVMTSTARDVSRIQFEEYSFGGDSWQRDDPSAAGAWPGPCLHCALAYDPTDPFHRWFVSADGKGQTLTWEWDVDRKTMAQRGSSTGTRHGQMIFDDTRHRPVWINFVEETPSSPLEVSEWTGKDWRSRTPLSPAASWPSRRDDFRIGYDRGNARILLMGGVDSSGTRFFSDLWSFDLNAGTWSEIRPSTIDAPWPEARAAHGFCVRGPWIFIYGGRDASGAKGDFWKGEFPF